MLVKLYIKTIQNFLLKKLGRLDLYFASNMPPKGFQHHQHHHTFWPHFHLSTLWQKCMEKAFNKLARVGLNLNWQFSILILPKSTEVKKYDFGQNVWWCWKPFGGILLAKYKSNRPSFFRRKFCMVLSYSFTNMSVRFLLQSQKTTLPVWLQARELKFRMNMLC
jgi:hypothetical protein